MTSKKQFTLPNGGATTDVELYSAAWKSPAKSIEDALGIQLMGFDPDYLFSKGNPQLMTTTVKLPSWFVRDMDKALRAK